MSNGHHIKSTFIVLAMIFFTVLLTFIIKDYKVMYNWWIVWLI